MRCSHCLTGLAWQEPTWPHSWQAPPRPSCGYRASPLSRRREQSLHWPPCRTDSWRPCCVSGRLQPGLLTAGCFLGSLGALQTHTSHVLLPTAHICPVFACRCSAVPGPTQLRRHRSGVVPAAQHRHHASESQAQVPPARRKRAGQRWVLFQASPCPIRSLRSPVLAAWARNLWACNRMSHLCLGPGSCLCRPDAQPAHTQPLGPVVPTWERHRRQGGCTAEPGAGGGRGACLGQGRTVRPA